MQVIYGNPAPTALGADGSVIPGPCVTVQGPLSDDPETGYSSHEDASVLAGKFARHMATGPEVHRLGDHSDGTGHHEAFLTAVTSWRQESRGTPSWVWSDNEDFAVLLGEFFDCPVGVPADVEDTHYTRAGAPGVGPAKDDQ